MTPEMKRRKVPYGCRGCGCLVLPQSYALHRARCGPVSDD